LVVGGRCPTVGAVGGFVQGGGHGILAGPFGLAVDNVLEYKVILANGDYVIANSCSYPDLFWALRGGGGGTFGVVTEVTYKTHVPPKVVQRDGSTDFIVNVSIAFTIHGRQDFNEVIKILFKILPSLSEKGWKGVVVAVNPKPVAMFVSLAIFGKTLEYSKSSLQILLDALKQNKSRINIPVFTTYSSMAAWGKDQIKGDSPTTIIGSRFLPREKFTPENVDEFALKFAELSYDYQFALTLIYQNPLMMDKSGTSVNPVWRTAVFNFVFTSSWKTATSFTATQKVIYC
jgi:hypothetical protein